MDLFIKQSQVASPTGAKIEALRALPPEGVAADVGELLKQLNLEQYIENFEKEGMELPVLLALARGELHTTYFFSSRGLEYSCNR